MKIHALKKIYESRDCAPVEALTGVSFDLPEKGLILITGKSGSGKTTLLNLLAGHLKPTAGEIVLHGRNIGEGGERFLEYYRNTVCAYLVQQYNLIPELTVAENVALPLEIQGKKDTADTVEKGLQAVGLAGYGARGITELSGGQQQRVAIARALAKDAKIIFADEPTSALDEKTGEEIFALLKKIAKDKLVVAVTHETQLAQKYADRIISLKNGRIVADSEAGFIGEERERDFAIEPYKLPAKTVWKLGRNGIRFHPVRFCAMLFVCVLTCILCLGFCSLAFGNGRERIAETVSASRDRWDIAFLKKPPDRDGRAVGFSFKEYEEIARRYATVALPVIRGDFSLGEYEKDAYALPPVGAAFLGEEEFSEMGYSLVGEFARDTDEVMITDYTARLLVRGGFIVTVDEAVGKTVTASGEQYRVSAVVHTDFSASPFANEEAVLKDSGMQLQYSRKISESFYHFLYFSRSAYAEFFEDSPFQNIVLSVSDFTYEEIRALVFGEEGTEMENYASVVASGLMDTAEELHPLIVALSVISGGLTLALVLFFVGKNMSDKEEEIAILRSLGVSKTSACKIFLWEGVLFAAIVSVAACLVGALLFFGLNGVLSARLGCAISLLSVGIWEAIATAVALLVAAVLNSLFALLKRYRRSS